MTIIQFISMIIVITSMMMLIIIMALVGCDVDSTVATHNLGLRAPPPHPDEPIWWCSLCKVYCCICIFISMCICIPNTSFPEEFIWWCSLCKVYCCISYFYQYVYLYSKLFLPRRVHLMMLIVQDLKLYLYSEGFHPNFNELRWTNMNKYELLKIT